MYRSRGFDTLTGAGLVNYFFILLFLTLFHFPTPSRMFLYSTRRMYRLRSKRWAPMISLPRGLVSFLLFQVVLCFFSFLFFFSPPFSSESFSYSISESELSNHLLPRIPSMYQVVPVEGLYWTGYYPTSRCVSVLLICLVSFVSPSRLLTLLPRFRSRPCLQPASSTSSQSKKTTPMRFASIWHEMGSSVRYVCRFL